MKGKVLSVEDISKMSGQQLSELYRQGYTLEGVIQESGCQSCKSTKSLDIETLIAACPTGKVVGNVVRLSARPTGGIVPYGVNFYRQGVPIKAIHPVAEGQTVTHDYILVEADKPSVEFGVGISDACPTGARTCSDTCLLTLAIVCTTPSCNFTVV